MSDAQTSVSPPEPAHFGLPALDPEGRPWSPLTLLILRQRRGEISLDEMMASAMPFVRRVARYAGAARRLTEEVEEITQELAILLYTDLHRDFDPARADAMSMLTTYARSVARTEERRADRRPVPMEEPHEVRSPRGVADGTELVTGIGGTGSARDGDDDPYFARLDQKLAERRIAAALGSRPEGTADRLSRNSKDIVRTRRDGHGRDASAMTTRKTARTGRPSTPTVVAQLPEVPISLGSVETIERRGAPSLATRKLPGERRQNELIQSQSKKPVSPQQRLLRETRRRLGYTAAEFAEKLGIGVPRLASYEYGITTDVPPEIMARLASLSRRQAAKAEALAAHKDKLIGNIVSEWEQKLRPHVVAILPEDMRPAPGEPLSIRDLARELNVNHVTLKRWWHSHTRPPETRIAAVDEHVKSRLAMHKARALKRRLSARTSS